MLSICFNYNRQVDGFPTLIEKFMCVNFTFGLLSKAKFKKNYK